MNSEKKKRTAAIIAACALIVAIIVAIAAWRAFVSPPGPESPDDGGLGSSDGASPAIAWSERGYASPEEVDADEGWTLNLFRDLAVMAGRGDHLAWEEVGEPDGWDFRVTDSATGESACFSLSDDARSAIAAAGVSDGVWGVV